VTLLAPLGCAGQPTNNEVEAWWACVQEVDSRLGPGAATHHPPILSDSVSVDYQAGAFLVSSSVTVRADSGPARRHAYTCRIRQSPLGVWEPAQVTLPAP
jgi:hypothetical protein